MRIRRPYSPIPNTHTHARINLFENLFFNPKSGFVRIKQILFGSSSSLYGIFTFFFNPKIEPNLAGIIERGYVFFPIPPKTRNDLHITVDGHKKRRLKRVQWTILGWVTVQPCWKSKIENRVLRWYEKDFSWWLGMSRVIKSIARKRRRDRKWSPAFSHRRCSICP